MDNNVIGYTEFFLNVGGVKASKDFGDTLEIEGWASTKDVDLVNDVILPSAFEKHFDQYTKFGRYWFNHDHQCIIGHVKQAHIEDDHGFYIDKAVLSPTRFNHEYLIPHLKNDAIKEHSVGFYSKDPYYKESICYHKELFLTECSIVSMACNPAALITNIKSLIPMEYFPKLASGDLRLDDLVLLEKQGRLRYPSDVSTSKTIHVPEGVETPEFMRGEEKTQEAEISDDNKEKMHNSTQAHESLTPDFADLEFQDPKISYDPDGETVGLPKRHEKGFADKATAIYLAKSKTRDAYLFRVGNITKDGGYSYDAVATGITLANLLGAKGPGVFAPDEKIALFEKVFEIYEKLEKRLPEYDGTVINNVSEDVLLTLAFNDAKMEYFNDEPLEVQKTILNSNLQSLQNSIQYFAKGEDKPVLEELIAKGMYHYGQICFDMYDLTPEELGALSTFITALRDMREYKSMNVKTIVMEDGGIEVEASFIDQEADVSDHLLNDTEEEETATEEDVDTADEAPELLSFDEFVASLEDDDDEDDEDYDEDEDDEDYDEDEDDEDEDED